MSPLQRIGGVGLIVVVAVIALVSQVTQRELLTKSSGINAEQSAGLSSGPSSVPPSGPLSGAITAGTLTWFDDLVATGHRDDAVRAALARLKAEGPKVPGASPGRDALIRRLIGLLPQLDPSLAREVEIALVKQPLNAVDAAALLARLEAITDPKLRTQALRKLLENDLAQRDLIRLLSDADPRVQAAAARSLRRQSMLENQQVSSSAKNALVEAQKNEADPRVRQAMMAQADDKDPVFPEDRRNSVVLPPAAERAPAHRIESIWEPTSSADNFVNRSTISIDHSGIAHVETQLEEPGGKWHVTYDAWAWKDANGNLIIDARGQPVNVIEAPPHSGWIPDSMTIKPDGTTAVIDDHLQRESGHSTQPGNG